MMRTGVWNSIWEQPVQRAGIRISNVSLKKIDEIEITEGDKGILADGNYVYNGSFQEGDGRLGYWDVSKNGGAEVSVTNENNIRRLMVNAPEGTSAEHPGHCIAE